MPSLSRISTLAATVFTCWFISGCQGDTRAAPETTTPTAFHIAIENDSPTEVLVVRLLPQGNVGAPLTAVEPKGRIKFSVSPADPPFAYAVVRNNRREGCLVIDPSTKITTYRTSAAEIKSCPK